MYIKCMVMPKEREERIFKIHNEVYNNRKAEVKE